MADSRPAEFDPLRVETTGTHLVEANAGTGKTHSLSALFLRVVVEGRIDLGAIALVTFTDAAARELRERLLGRLRELSRILQQPAAGAARPSWAVELLALAPAEPADALARRVRDALLRFDEVTVATIHGFCRRALERLGLATGVRESVDPGPLRDGLVADFWRQRVLGGDAAEAAWALTQWREPTDLAQDLVDAHALPATALDPPRDRRTLDEVAQRLRRARVEGRALYERGLLDATVAHLEDAVYLAASGDRYDNGGLERIARVLADWFESGPEGQWPLAELDLLRPATVLSFRSSRNSPKGWDAPRNPLTDWIEAWYAVAAGHERERTAQFRHEALAFVAAGMQRLRAESGAWTHDELIAELDAALQRPESVARAGAALAPGGGRRIPGHRCAPVRDLPADLRPRRIRLVPGRRSEAGDLPLPGRRHPRLCPSRARRRQALEPVGQLARRPGAGRGDQRAVRPRRRRASVPGRLHRLPSFALAARSASPRLRPGPRMHRWCSGMRPARDAASGPARDAMTALATQATAAEIARLLAHACAQGVAAPSIAVLAPTHRDLAAMARTLRDWRIPAVAQERDSVYANPVVADLAHLLRALLDGGERAFAGAMALPLFGLPLAQLAAARAQAGADAGWALREALRECWRERGPLALLLRLLAEVAPRWIGEAEGPRRHADLLQVGEFLEAQRAAGARHGCGTGLAGGAAPRSPGRPRGARRAAAPARGRRRGAACSRPTPPRGCSSTWCSRRSCGARAAASGRRASLRCSTTMPTGSCAWTWARPDSTTIARCRKSKCAGGPAPGLRRPDPRAPSLLHDLGALPWHGAGAAGCAGAPAARPRRRAGCHARRGHAGRCAGAAGACRRGIDPGGRAAAARGPRAACRWMRRRCWRHARRRARCCRRAAP